MKGHRCVIVDRRSPLSTIFVSFSLSQLLSSQLLMAHNLQGKKKVHEPRTLVLCFDGTGNSFSDEITNVVRLFSALEKRKREQQLCYYQPGIGLR